MSGFTKSLKARRLALLLLSSALLGVLAGAATERSDQSTLILATQSAPAGKPLVTSASSAVRIVGSQRTTVGENAPLDVSLQNTSTKNIKSYSIASGKAWVTRSYFFLERSFAPGTTEKQLVPLSGASFNEGGKEFILTGVLFEDGTTDGQPVSVFRLRETFEGLRDQAKSLLPCLDQLPASLISQHEVDLLRCESEATKLSTKGRSSDYEDGLRNAQREFLAQLNEIRQKVRSNDLSGAAHQKKKVIKVFQALHHPE